MSIEMHSKRCKYLYCLYILCCVSCTTPSQDIKVSATNSTSIYRKSATIEVPISELESKGLNLSSPISVVDEANNPVRSQLISHKRDTIAGLLIFQANLPPNTTQTFKVSNTKATAKLPNQALRTYARLVPERMDDFAWENDKVAFRTYGPECQQLFEAGDPTGLISSGIDCWLKRVDYPIIDKWYEQHKQGKSYHQDHGEGLDNYHVGTSRGCGGTAIVRDRLYALSENFVEANIIANGPIRTVFELTFAPQKIGPAFVATKKTFSIDLGQYYYHCTIKYESKPPIEKSAIGIAHHDKEGTTYFEPKTGLLACWEPLDDSFLGTFLVIEKTDSATQYHKGSQDHWVKANNTNNQLSYIAGYGWQKAGQFNSSQAWEAFVKLQAQAFNNPLIVNVK